MKKIKELFNIHFLRILIASFALSALISCGSSNKETSQTSEDNAAPALLQELNNTREIAAPAATNVENSEQAPESTEPVETNSLVKLNPPHGEPGHRCDIAVGAPLDSPKPNNDIQTTSTSTTTTPAAPAVNTPANNSGRRVGPTIENLQNFRPSQPINSSSVSVNPPHGQPGHRCDIPVGDPLPTAANSNVSINPPHGQPGHRCDIPVGDPLPS